MVKQTNITVQYNSTKAWAQRAQRWFSGYTCLILVSVFSVCLQGFPVGASLFPFLPGLRYSIQSHHILNRNLRLPPLPPGFTPVVTPVGLIFFFPLPDPSGLILLTSFLWPPTFVGPGLLVSLEVSWSWIATPTDSSHLFSWPLSFVQASFPIALTQGSLSLLASLCTSHLCYHHNW